MTNTKGPVSPNPNNTQSIKQDGVEKDRENGTEGVIMGADGGGDAGEPGDRVIHSHRERSPHRGSRPHCEDDQPVLPPGYAHAERIIPHFSGPPGDAGNRDPAPQSADSSGEAEVPEVENQNGDEGPEEATEGSAASKNC